MCLCVCSCRGSTCLRWFQHACFMYMWCSSLFFSPWIPQQGDINPFALPWQKHADLEQTLDYGYMHLSAQMAVNRKWALCYVPPSVYQFSNIFLGINRLRHTCNEHCNSWECTAGWSSALTDFIRGFNAPGMAGYSTTMIYAQWEE